MKRTATLLALAAFVFAGCTGCNNNKDKAAEADSNTAVKPPSGMSYTVLKTFPHDNTSFTEGFFLLDGLLYESTGLKGKSRLLKAELETGKVIKKNRSR